MRQVVTPARMPVRRETGSAEDFEHDWATALRSRNDRWFAYPDFRGNSQVALVEWVKAQQTLGILRAAGISQGRILEYGCGSAGMSIFLKERGFDTCIADISGDALKVAQINDERHRTCARPLQPVLADALCLPFASRTFEVAMSYGLLEHFDEAPLRALLREVCRTLKPGGLLIADIIPARFNARAVGNAINLAASAAWEAVRGRWDALPGLRRAYFDHYHETSFGPEVYQCLLSEQGLEDISVQVCRPFPPLAVDGKLEEMYVRGMRRLLPVWRRFDQADSWFSRRWGWMYFVSARRPVESPP
jgi:SAM-dependent methyltransferase